jgi:hypothetical protein
VQIARARLKQWTPRVETRFLAVLAATCNVKAACAEIGMTAASAYGHRKRWPRFAALWDEAVEEGYARLELALVENGCNLFSRSELPSDVPIKGMTAEQAIHLLHMHKYQVRGIGKAPGLPERQPTFDEVGAYFARTLGARERAATIDARTKARDRREWARRREKGGAPDAD